MHGCFIFYGMFGMLNYTNILQRPQHVFPFQDLCMNGLLHSLKYINMICCKCLTIGDYHPLTQLKTPVLHKNLLRLRLNQFMSHGYGVRHPMDKESTCHFLELF